MNIILIGPRSVGKSTVGKLLAKKLGHGYVEFDEIVDKKLNGTDDYCKKHGADPYRHEERKILIELLKALQGDFIMCVGGGTVASQLHEVSEQNANDLKKYGKLVYLNPANDESEAIKLLRGREISREGNQSLEHTKGLYTLRKQVYEKIKDFEIIVKNKTTQEIVEEISHQFKEK